MTRAIVELRNLGPKMARRLAEVGIEDEDDLRRVGPADAYARLRFAADRPVSLIALYAMHAALSGCDWRDLSGTEKAALRDAHRKLESGTTIGKITLDGPD